MQLIELIQLHCTDYHGALMSRKVLPNKDDKLKKLTERISGINSVQ